MTASDQMTAKADIRREQQEQENLAATHLKEQLTPTLIKESYGSCTGERCINLAHCFSNLRARLLIAQGCLYRCFDAYDIYLTVTLIVTVSLCSD